MAKLYSKEFKKVHGRPKRETIKFILNYSKAYRVTKYKALYFENILN